MCPGRTKNRHCGSVERPTNCTSAWAAHPPRLSWPKSWEWARRRSWRRWPRSPVARRCPWTGQSALRLAFHLASWWPPLGAREEPEDLLALPGMVAALPELERKVIMLRFFQDLDQYEIAARVGCSQMHVSRLQRRALGRMHAQLVEP
jgi:RNA polymerase sigma factor (sigma-70 family)